MINKMMFFMDDHEPRMSKIREMFPTIGPGNLVADRWQCQCHSTMVYWTHDITHAVACGVDLETLKTKDFFTVIGDALTSRPLEEWDIYEIMDTAAALRAAELLGVRINQEGRGETLDIVANGLQDQNGWRKENRYYGRYWMEGAMKPFHHSICKRTEELAQYVAEKFCKLVEMKI